MAEILQEMPQIGEVFRMTGSFGGDPSAMNDPVFGVYTQDGIQQLNLQDQLQDYAGLWKDTQTEVKGILDGYGRSTEFFEGGDSFTINGETYTGSYQSGTSASGGGRYLTFPDGTKVKVQSLGSSSQPNELASAILKYTGEIPEGVNVGDNLDVFSAKNMAAIESFVLGDMDTGSLNTYAKGLINDYISDTPMSVSEFTDYSSGATSTDKGYINQTIAPEGTAQPTGATPWEAESEASYQKWMAEKEAMAPQLETRNDPEYQKWLDEKAAQEDQLVTRSGTAESIPNQIGPANSDGLSFGGDLLNKMNETGFGTDAFGGQASAFDSGSINAQQLVNKAFQMDATKNLTSYDWWNSNPDRNEAYNMIKDIISSPDKMAQYVKSQGYENLTSYDWWNEYPGKVEAWGMIEQTNTNAENYSMGSTETSSPVSGNIVDAGWQLENESMRPVDGVDMTDPKMYGLDIIMSSGLLSEEEKLFFKDVFRGWNPDDEVNVEAIIKEFTKIRDTTISPRYQTMAKQFTDQATSARDYSVAAREREMEQERTEAGQNIRQARSELEQRGMTFTGEGTEKLGELSALAREGDSAIPTQTALGATENAKEGMTFDDGRFYEGTVNQASRLMSSSLQSRYLKNMEEMARQAENVIGSGATAMLAMPGANLTGGVAGTMEDQKQSELAGTASMLAEQARMNLEHQDRLNPIA